MLTLKRECTSGCGDQESGHPEQTHKGVKENKTENARFKEETPLMLSHWRTSQHLYIPLNRAQKLK